MIYVSASEEYKIPTTEVTDTRNLIGLARNNTSDVTMGTLIDSTENNKLMYSNKEGPNKIQVNNIESDESEQGITTEKPNFASNLKVIEKNLIIHGGENFNLSRQTVREIKSNSEIKETEVDAEAKLSLTDKNIVNINSADNIKPIGNFMDGYKENVSNFLSELEYEIFLFVFKSIIILCR